MKLVLILVWLILLLPCACQHPAGPSRAKSLGMRPPRGTDDAPKSAKEHKRKPVELTAEALRIHRSALLIDGHNDLPWWLR